ncbi:MAG TPA: energy-coupling factor ABC transporter permease [Planctomycetia bacterium]|nr:energy-coupling factor ABC transporter permease [Planctomycetia bacterium]
MHIPDGFLDPLTSAGCAAAAATVVGVALARLNGKLHERAVPLLGVTAAGVFAAQMVNFPIPGGTSGHLLGGAIAASLVGPWAGLVAMTCVLVVQCLLFGDGGLWALGANVLNLGVVGCFLGYCVYSPLRRWIGGPRGAVVAGVIAAWVTTVVGAATCAWQLALSGVAPAAVALRWMVGIHAIIGVGEALLTGLVLVWLARSRPELLEPPQESAMTRTMQILVAGAALALVIAIILAPFASSLPDGLEKVAAELGFLDRAAASPLQAAMPDYRAPWLAHPALATSAAGATGTLVVLGLALFLGRSLRTGWR